MADPRFFDNHGPFTLATVFSCVGIALPEGCDAHRKMFDVATLEGAEFQHVVFHAGEHAAESLRRSRAGCCFVSGFPAPASTTQMLIAGCESAHQAFAAVARLFYPEHGLPAWNQERAIHASARIGDNVALAPGVVLGPDVEIGDRTRIGPNTSIGRGVAIGRDCEIGSNVAIACAYIGDGVLVLPGAQIGQPGFGFTSSARGHEKMPQLGRVLIQDRTEIGASTAIDRGALGDTVIGEGTKIDNLVQIGHNTHVGRHCVVVAQTGVSGSCELGNFVVLGGQAGVADHARIGDGARLAARCAAAPGDLPGGEDYGGVPARPMKQWRRELAAVALLAKRRKQDRNG